MKKLNKKGFTLIELLAVIVVLAIIMVIATQQINGTIKKSRADSLVSSLKIVHKQAKSTYIQYGDTMTADNVAENVDYNPKEYTISLSGNNVCLEAVKDGKFSSVNKADIKAEDGMTVTENTTTKLVKICKPYK